ncbi:MAG: hypothetical protein R2761_06680 [Acidimicrobiales bacterium]
MTVARSKTPTIRGALDELRARGLADIASADLEVYRLVMLPATFQKLCHRLDVEVANLTRDRMRAHACPELPFGADLAGEVAASMAVERRRQWAIRPNGEPYPLTWSIHREFSLPGRARLVTGREFSVRGERGRFRFRHAVTTDTGETWVDAWDGEGRCRSLRPERIRVVHVKSKVRPPRERVLALRGRAGGRRAGSEPLEPAASSDRTPAPRSNTGDRLVVSDGRRRAVAVTR